MTVARIAEACEVSEQTVFNYFPTKEDVFLDPRRIDREFASAALNARMPDEDDIALVMRVLVEVRTVQPELVEYVTAEGFVCVGRAVLKGSVLGAELTAHIARTSEIPQSWLENLPRGA